MNRNYIYGRYLLNSY